MSMSSPSRRRRSRRARSGSAARKARCCSSASSTAAVPPSVAACVKRTGMLHAAAGRRCSICASSERMRSAPSRSALFTRKMSAISSRPAFITCTASPASGTRTTTVVSARRITSSSVCPTPTVSTRMRSMPKASRRRITSRVARATPPWLPRLARLRMNTPGSRKWACMRMRSPSTAPPLKGLVGSTATTPTRWPAARSRAVMRSLSVDFPAPGGPVTPITCARPVCGWSRLMSAGRPGARFSTSVIRRARATRSPPSMRSMSCCSLTREPRRALLDERGHALAHIGGREEPSLGNSLIFHDRLQCGSEARVQVRLDRLQGERRAIGEATGKGRDRRGEPRLGIDMVHEADPVRLGGVEQLARHGQLVGPEPHQPGQEPARAAVEGEPDAHEDEREARALRREANVGREREARAVPGRHPVDGGDDGLRHAPDGADDRVVSPLDQVAGERRGRLLQVRAGGEGAARAGQDDGAHGRVLARRRQPAVEAGDQRLVERVAPRGAVQGERQHAGIEALEQRVVHAHPIAQTFLGARPLLAYARCAPTPARLRIRPPSSRPKARATSATSWRSPSSLSTNSCCGPGGSSPCSAPSSSRSACCACGCARRAPRGVRPARIDFPSPGTYNADKFAQRSGGRPDAGESGAVAGGRRPGPGRDEPESSAAVGSLVALLARVLGLERAALLVEKSPRDALVPVAVHGDPPPAPLAPGEAPDATWSLALPVGAGDRVGGLLLLARAGGAPLTPAERALAAGVADALAQLVASERQAAELRQTRELLGRADRLSALGMLAAGVAHEIRNPLVSVRTFLQLLPERRADEHLRTEFRELALGEIERICALINDPLAFSRPAPAERKPTDLNELAAQIARLLEAEARRRDVAVAFHGEADLPRVVADEAP